jgi:hypothetical protein
MIVRCNLVLNLVFINLVASAPVHKYIKDRMKATSSTSLQHTPSTSELDHSKGKAVVVEDSIPSEDKTSHSIEKTATPSSAPAGNTGNKRGRKPLATPTARQLKLREYKATFKERQKLKEAAMQSGTYNPADFDFARKRKRLYDTFHEEEVKWAGREAMKSYRERQKLKAEGKLYQVYQPKERQRTPNSTHPATVLSGSVRAKARIKEAEAREIVARADKATKGGKKKSPPGKKKDAASTSRGDEEVAMTVRKARQLLKKVEEKKRRMAEYKKLYRAKQRNKASVGPADGASEAQQTPQAEIETQHKLRGIDLNAEPSTSPLT